MQRFRTLDKRLAGDIKRLHHPHAQMLTAQNTSAPKTCLISGRKYVIYYKGRYAYREYLDGKPTPMTIQIMESARGLLDESAIS